jgi:Cof subfamily protein (haloacid dehalogenase superfamily)
LSDIKAIVLDLDGTLLGSDKSISSRNYGATKRCFDSGIHIIIATARPPRSAQRFVKDLVPFIDYLVFYNGALVTCKSKQMQRHTSISTGVSQQITKFIKVHEPQSVISYEVNDSWYTSTPIPDSQCSQLGILPTDPKPGVVDNNFISSISPTKILVLGYNSWKDIIEKFGEHVNVIATDGGVLVQIMHKSASKENAVQWALSDIGVKPKNAMVFGDDFNDLGLLNLCGFPIAMGNAINELKSCAKYVTESNDNNGVAVALEKFVL